MKGEKYTSFAEVLDAVIIKKFEEKSEEIGDLPKRKVKNKFKIIVKNKGERHTQKHKKRLWQNWIGMSPKTRVKKRRQLKNRKGKKKDKKR